MQVRKSDLKKIVREVLNEARIEEQREIPKMAYEKTK